MKKEMTYTELAKETAILTAAVAIIAAVSYTHLDVYKRQDGR